jgi:hypothetical protein
VFAEVVLPKITFVAKYKVVAIGFPALAFQPMRDI